MNDETKEINESPTTEIVAVDLQAEALTLVNQIAAETDVNKLKDLTYLFNINDTKKSIMAMNKESELKDLLLDTTLGRVRNNANNFSNDDLAKLLKLVMDLMEKERAKINRDEESPLIQINQQTNEVNVGDDLSGYNRESRNKIKDAVMDFLKDVAANRQVIDATVKEVDEDDN